MQVQDILKAKGNEVVATRLGATISEAAKLLAARNIGAALVRNGDGEVVGILSERDIVRGIARHGEFALLMPVQMLMSRNVQMCRPQDAIKEVMTTMTLRRIRHLPVIEHGELCGLISIGDVVRHRVEEMELETNVLRDYIMTTR